MRRIAVVGMVILAVVALPLVVGAKAGDKPAKVTICHIPDAGEAHEIVVSERALEAHLGHGDPVGDCPSDSDLPPLNTAPVAVINVSASCSYFTGCALTLDGQDSFDDESDPLIYAWVIIAPNGSETTSDWPALAISGDPGTYQVSLTVSDGELFDTKVISVLAALP
jgi:hypothetical protein